MESFDIDQSQLISTRVEDFITPQQFVGNVDWINRNIVAKGKGTFVEVGHIIGYAVKTKRRVHRFGDDEIESIELEGEFESVSLIDGQVREANIAFIPSKFAKLAEKAVLGLDPSDPAGRIKMILKIGVEATGKSIPYRWTVETCLPRAKPQLDELRQLALKMPGNRLIEAEAAD